MSATEFRMHARKSNLPIRLSFSNPKPLSLQLRKSQPVPCPSTCCCDNKGLCLKKNVVYDVNCNLCPQPQGYIGSSHRTLHKRTGEHFTKDDSNVFRHFQQSHPGEDVRGNVAVHMLDNSCENTMHRLALEASYIKKRNPAMNIQVG